MRKLQKNGGAPFLPHPVRISTAVVIGEQRGEVKFEWMYKH